MSSKEEDASNSGSGDGDTAPLYAGDVRDFGILTGIGSWTMTDVLGNSLRDLHCPAGSAGFASPKGQELPA
jgi:hypothetical protein